MITFAFLLLLKTSAFSASNLVTEIKIQGLQKTSEHVVERELLLKNGQIFDQTLWDESIQRIRNLQVFSLVLPEMQITPEGYKLRIQLKEKWTLVPIVKLGGGGDIQFYTLGAYNVNSFGQYIELGGQYENLGGRHNGVIWFRKPRIYDSSWKVGGDLWSTLRGVTTYDSEGESNGAYILNRRKINIFTEKELSSHLIFGFGFESIEESFLNDMLSEKDIAANQMNRSMFSDKMTVNQPRASVTIGRLNYDNHLVDGTALVLTQEYLLSSRINERFNLDLRSFYLLSQYWNIGFRYFMSETNSEFIQHQPEAGGLREVRGYQDARFRGSAMHFFNFDARKDIYSNSLYILQAIGFIDGGGISDKSTRLLQASEDFYSVGLGLRAIVPSVYRLNLRFDTALATSDKNPSRVSFGLQQFF